MWQNVRYSVRMLRRSPGFSLMAIAILSLGIGASTAAFSIVNSVFFRTVAVPEPERLVYVYTVQENGRRYPSYGENYVNAFGGRFDNVFSGITAHQRRSAILAANDESTQVYGEVVRANYFDVLGVRPARGRGFEPKEDDPTNASFAVVISDSLWAKRFSRDPKVLGKQVRLGNYVYSVIGVTPPGFEGLTDIWSPSQFWVTVVQYNPLLTTIFPRSVLGTVARLKPGVSLEEAQALVDVQSPSLQLETMRALPPRTWKPSRQAVVPAPDIDNPQEPDSWVIAPQLLSGMAIAVSIVLVIAATNIAGVLAARGVTRAQEVAVRQALGAGASQLLRQLLTESVLLAIGGGAFGLLLAWVIAQAYQSLWPARFAVEATFNLRLVLFTAGMCLVSGIVVGLVPALQAARVNVVTALAAGSTSGRNSRTRSRLRHGIVIPQIALCMALLVVGGVHVRTLVSLETADLGYTIDNIVTMRTHHWDVPRPGDDFMDKGVRDARGSRDRQYANSLVGKLRDLQGVEALAITSSLPVFGPSPAPSTTPGVVTEGMNRFTTKDSFWTGTPAVGWADAAYVSAGYFRTMGQRLIEGRDFDERDAMTTPAVAIVSERLAERLWPGRRAIGQSLAWYMHQLKGEPWWLEVVGVVSETRPVREPDATRAMVYTALSQTWQPSSLEIVARHDGNAVPVISALKKAVASADDFSEIRAVRSLTQVADEILFPRRAAVGVLLACGAAGLLLACVGIYGVISHSVAQRMQEIGIRATLGANRRDILSLVLREAVAVSIAGALPALGLALIALKLTANAVGKVPVFDLLTFATVIMTGLGIILAASYLPARRASRLDPMTVLRGL